MACSPYIAEACAAEVPYEAHVRDKGAGDDDEY